MKNKSKSKSSLPKKLFGGGDGKPSPLTPGIWKLGKRMNNAADVLSKVVVPGMKKGGSVKKKK